MGRMYDTCPECGDKMILQEGCCMCPSCGFGGCGV